ncbi:hypothetical protein ACFOMD_14345 [Sphingoaurantiacus capsulatus]|uniref:Uncharacterized protein n=1 Tax=Sphingoaurantiacus capsulatus TaxID=1771310 RepID=A0ABV7XF97_9SPHN
MQPEDETVPPARGNRTLRIVALVMWLTITALHAAVIILGAKFGGIEGALIGGVFAFLFWAPLTRTMITYMRR